MTRYTYKRRRSHPVRVGSLTIGGDAPVAVQSMTNTSTLDTAGSARQIEEIAEAGGALVRLTTQGVREAANLGEIRKAMEKTGCKVPISADVHFNPKAAFEAALHADKVRINPGNFVDAARTFRHLEYTDEEYKTELERIRLALVPLLDLCRERGVALRLGVNHGSLSDRIMSRYGNTPEGMVESVMEYLRIASTHGFDNIIISIKSSNTAVMVSTVRLLAETLEKEGMDYPLHLGVTEAGDGEDGRIKSAVGIGALLHDGLGDTIRVSLSEAPANEIPVAITLRDYVTSRSGEPETLPHADIPQDNVDNITDATLPLKEYIFDNPPHLGSLAARIDRDRAKGVKNPVKIKIIYPENVAWEDLQIRAGADFGWLLLSGYGDEIEIECTGYEAEKLRKLEADIMQAARKRFYKTEYIACPSCGRTLFDLPEALHKVRQGVDALGIKGLKIGVMGCIVNGPGEMADADYGYVGAGPGRVSIYRGKEVVIKNIETSDALPALLNLITQDYKAKDSAGHGEQ